MQHPLEMLHRLFALNFAHGSIVYLLFPETFDRSLEELDSLFLDDKNKIFVVDKKGRL